MGMLVGFLDTQRVKPRRPSMRAAARALTLGVYDKSNWRPEATGLFLMVRIFSDFTEIAKQHSESCIPFTDFV